MKSVFVVALFAIIVVVHVSVLWIFGYSSIQCLIKFLIKGVR